MKKYLIRAKRYLLFLAQYLLYEKPRGLDFTMRNTEIYERSNGECHGYSKTSEKYLREAAKYPFQWIDGIEIQPQLVKTAQKNFRVLKIEDRIRCIFADAAELEKYGEYDLFFLFNPFLAEILVLKMVLTGHPLP